MHRAYLYRRVADAPGAVVRIGSAVGVVYLE